MNIRVGDVLQWHDSESCGKDAGRLFLVIGEIHMYGVAQPQLIVSHEDGSVDGWSTSALQKYASLVQRAAQPE